MGDLTIFKDQSNLPANVVSKGVSDLGKTINTGGVRRIKTSTNGTFTKIVGGQKSGKAVRGAFNAIIVDMLPSVSRQFYAQAYDPDAKPTMPDCWSNLGVKPEDGAKNPQSRSCATCPQNVTGSGEKGKGRACRYQRRIALLLAGDNSGDVYQFNIPAKSLFGEGNGHVHPYESYCKFLVGNEFSPDRVVTRIEYDDEEETMVLKFSPIRPITEDELELVEAAQRNPLTRQLIELTVAAADGADSGEAKPKPKPKAKAKAEPEADPFGGDDDDIEDAEYSEVDDDEEDEPAPKKRKSTTKPKAKAAAVADSPEMADALSGWLDDEEEED